jgi:hypothetical protein
MGIKVAIPDSIFDSDQIGLQKRWFIVIVVIHKFVLLSIISSFRSP